MDFGSVVLENRPIVICQCKINICALCNVPIDEHPTLEDKEKFSESFGPHNFFQRSKLFGPRVVIHQDTKRGQCNDCGKEYIVEIHAINDFEGAIKYDEVVPY